MTARQTLDRTVLRITGKDIRLVGNWSRLWCLQHHSAEIAHALGVNERDLIACKDITEILQLRLHEPATHSTSQQTLSLFR